MLNIFYNVKYILQCDKYFFEIYLIMFKNDVTNKIFNELYSIKCSFSITFSYGHETYTIFARGQSKRGHIVSVQSLCTECKCLQSLSGQSVSVWSVSVQSVSVQSVSGQSVSVWSVSVRV